MKNRILLLILAAILHNTTFAAQTMDQIGILKNIKELQIKNGNYDHLLQDIGGANICSTLDPHLEHVKIGLFDITGSTINIHIPSNIKTISLSGDSIGGSIINFYARHNVRIDKSHLNNIGGSCINDVMHPIRYYTVPITCSAAIIAFYYFFVKD